MPLDPQRAWLKGPDFFPRFDVSEPPTSLGPLGLAAATELLVVQRGDASHAYISPQLAYHHCAQSELAGEAYVVSY